jgi:cellulose synthase/poly-beta-1,6-N-acetylglucosamine synthase-like glycosyltransferase
VIGCNGAYRSECLRVVSYPDRTLGEDVLFSNEIQERGFTLMYDPTIEIRHQNRAGWGEFFSYNREMGRKAAQCQQLLGRWWTAPFRAIPSLAFAVPAVILPSIALRLARGHRADFFRFLLLSPMCLLGNLAWADGYRRGVLDDRASHDVRTRVLKSQEAHRADARGVWLSSRTE